MESFEQNDEDNYPPDVEVNGSSWPMEIIKAHKKNSSK